MGRTSHPSLVLLLLSIYIVSYKNKNKKGKGIKYFKCQEPSHMAYNCPKKNLHIGLEHEEEPKLQKDEQNENSFPNRLLFSEVTPLDAT